MSYFPDAQELQKKSEKFLSIAEELKHGTYMTSKQYLKKK